MHEASLINALLEQAADVAKRHGGEIAEIAVEVGPLSGVEPELLASAFELLAPDRIGGDARLVIESVALLATCHDCGAEFEIADFYFVCTKCGSHALRVTQGDGLMMKHVKVRQREAEEIASP